jgi:hypothetical protein
VTVWRGRCHTRESGYPDFAASAAVALDSRVRGNDMLLSAGGEFAFILIEPKDERGLRMSLGRDRRRPA